MTSFLGMSVSCLIVFIIIAVFGCSKDRGGTELLGDNYSGVGLDPLLSRSFSENALCAGASFNKPFRFMAIHVFSDSDHHDMAAQDSVVVTAASYKAQADGVSESNSVHLVRSFVNGRHTSKIVGVNYINRLYDLIADITISHKGYRPMLGGEFITIEMSEGDIQGTGRRFVFAPYPITVDSFVNQDVNTLWNRAVSMLSEELNINFP